MSAVQEWWPWYPWWDPHVQCWWWLVPNSSMPQSKVCRSSWGCRCLRGREARNPEIWREIECDLMEKNGNGFRVSPESVNSSLLPWMTINTENPESEIWLNSEGWIYGGVWGVCKFREWKCTFTTTFSKKSRFVLLNLFTALSIKVVLFWVVDFKIFQETGGGAQIRSGFFFEN